MAKLILNIGLNVGDTEPHNQLNKTITSISNIGTFQRLCVNDNSFYEAQNIKERSLIVEIETNRTEEDILFGLIVVATKLKQDSIAYEYNGNGNLSFGEQYKGEVYTFDYNYFHKF
jgi:hypothetical protein